ncbi:bifunctional protein FolD 4, chloroplastic-like isoform X1 [Salvia hispanica]|uniref:bifunctional protein FolD 4, chloroplastic-like isoform X1 n=1 Tax=Salvia hispanica TaxID=49212 RepID=UPI002009705E|nr:bifunctional protein FolD 4, chloroplastic-like isoform X1 [Salvia hispanica]
MASAAATSSTATMFGSAAASDGCSRRVFVTTTVQVRASQSSPAFLRTSRAIKTYASCSNSSVVNEPQLGRWHMKLSIAALVTEASAKVIDGKATAKEIREEIAAEISKMKESSGVVPGLAVILVGERKDSATYVRNKKKACEAVGIKSYEVHLAEDCSEQEVLEHISAFNDDPAVNGILVQLPLPSHMNEQNILNAVCIEKDVDGFSPLNIGRLAMRDREPLFVPCTPKGCIELLHRYGVPIKGKRAVVIGRSNIVGMPAALLLQREDATVTVVHSRTKNPEAITREADIVITAVGQPNMVRGSWIKPGAVVIDVGINPVEDTSCSRGYRLVGDVCYEEASKIASAITPVPGGVGPMTIAMLLSNTLSAAKRAYNLE